MAACTISVPRPVASDPRPPMTAVSEAQAVPEISIVQTDPCRLSLTALLCHVGFSDRFQPSPQLALDSSFFQSLSGIIDWFVPRAEVVPSILDTAGNPSYETSSNDVTFNQNVDDPPHCLKMLVWQDHN